MLNDWTKRNGKFKCKTTKNGWTRRVEIQEKKSDILEDHRIQNESALNNKRAGNSHKQIDSLNFNLQVFKSNSTCDR